MEVDDHRFKSARNKIFYVASRIQGPAFTHIESFVNSTRTNDDTLPQFGKWEDIFTLVLNRIYDVADSSAVFGIQYSQYSQYSQYHFSISKAKPTSSICTENIEKDFSIPTTALADRKAASEQEMATLKQGNMLFVEFLRQVHHITGGLKVE
jgi:hypothetical protein